MNENIKKCIFHMPMGLSVNPQSGSELRPVKMIQAFRNLGYYVEIISGDSSARRSKIARIKKNILQGNKYEFIYSESSTMPTLLTDNDHLSRHPFLDFSFFKFCRQHDIKIGLFYRDAHWKFPLYYQDIKKWIPWVTIPLYKYDLHMYEKLVDILYVPSNQFMDYFNLNIPWKQLPPGCVSAISDERVVANEVYPLQLFYVGGIQLHYEIVSLIKAVNSTSHIEMTLCCHKDAWDKYQYLYKGDLCDRIKIIHKNAAELTKYYQVADVGCLCFKKSEYMDLAMPIKMFEYIGNGLPIIATKGTAAAEFIESNDIGWTVEYSVEAIRKLLNYLEYNRAEVLEKKKNVLKIVSNNTWEARASTVVNDLSPFGTKKG